MSIGNSEMSSSSGLVSSPFVASRDYASAACCSIPAWYTTWKLHSDSRRRHQATRPVDSAKLKFHFSASRSVRMVNR